MKKVYYRYEAAFIWLLSLLSSTFENIFFNDLLFCFRDNAKMALRSQSFNERRSVSVARAQAHSDGDISDETDDVPINMVGVSGKRKFNLIKTLDLSGAINN